ncbi:MAG TPA: hemerythrin domain-containing protein [Prolixibacteraceae bacterium]|nr:hemerythrin domain-containing protein [Prolixibacteraceae bacterium]
MKIFTENEKMVHLVQKNHNLLPVLNRFGIRLGFKDKTIGEICKDTSINTSFFLAIVNTYNSPEYFPQDELQSFSPLLIIQYLKKTHQYYQTYVLPKMEKQLDLIIAGSGENYKDLQLIDAFYKKYKEELLNHIQDEETHVFPYVENLVHHPGKWKGAFKIMDFEKQHTNVEMQINDLKNLIIKYLNPVYNDNDCNEFLTTVFNFEKDITDHARIEDAILVPQVMKLEKELAG